MSVVSVVCVDGRSGLGWVGLGYTSVTSSLWLSTYCRLVWPGDLVSLGRQLAAREFIL